MKIVHPGFRLGGGCHKSARSSSPVVSFAGCVVPAEVEQGVVSDEDDLPVLGTVVAGRCDMLVTGDAELLALRRFEGIPVVTPRECHERLVG